MEGENDFFINGPNVACSFERRIPYGGLVGVVRISCAWRGWAFSFIRIPLAEVAADASGMVTSLRNCPRICR
jgi:hypothetical protein